MSQFCPQVGLFIYEGQTNRRPQTTNILIGTLEEQAIELIDNTGLTLGTVARLVGPPMTAKYLFNKLSEHNRGRLKAADLVAIKKALRGLASTITVLIGESQMPEAADLAA